VNNTEKALVFIDTLDQSKREVGTIRKALLKQIAQMAEYADYEEYGTAFVCKECNSILKNYRPNYCPNCGQKVMKLR